MASGPLPPAEIPRDLSLADPIRPRLDSLTGLRWLAALWVFGYHLLGLGAVPFPLDYASRLGYLGITFFFVLSGFVLTWSMRTSVPVSTFYTRRFARIWPAHLVALLLAVPVFTRIGEQAGADWMLPFSIPVLLLSVFLVQGFSRDPAILFSGNPAAWTLSCEAFFYALHPLMGRLFRLVRVRGALLVAAGAIAVAFAYRIVSVQAPEPFAAVPLPFVHLPEFVLGAALAWAMAAGWRPRIPVPVAWIIVGAVLAWLSVGRDLGFGLASRIAVLFPSEIATVACGLIIVAVAGASLRGARSFLEHPVMIRLGNWSYAFYLVHGTVIYGMLLVVGDGLETDAPVTVLWGLLIFVLSLALAAAIHHGVEVPTERRIRQWKDRRSDARARPDIA